MIVSKTPTRVSLFGGSSDHPAWYKQHGGEVLGFTINYYHYVTVRPVKVKLPGWRHRVVWSEIENVVDIHDIHHPTIREAMRLVPPSHGVEIIHTADLPSRSGLGSSSSCTVGVLNALHALRGRTCSPSCLAERATHIERDILGETVGDQDQLWAAHGGFNRIVFPQHGPAQVHPVVVTQERKEDLNRHLMMFFTGLTRSASEIEKKKVAAFEDRDSRSILIDFADMAGEAAEQISDVEMPITFVGHYLHEAWMMKKRLADGITNAVIDDAYEAARKAGAIGGKLLGAGGGGFMLLFVPPERQVHVRAALDGLTDIPFRIGSQGSRIISYNAGSD